MRSNSDPAPRAAIVGGGPAGLMAAETLAVAGISVTIFDHRRSLGRKLLLAGRGGLNITTDAEVDALLDRYGPDRPKLEAAVRAFGPREVQAWCAGLNEPTFSGTSGHVFPKSFRATPLLRAWLRRLDELGVRFHGESRWGGWADDGGLRFNGQNSQVSPNAVIFALGGASWPNVGSDGSWVEAFERDGVEVVRLQPSNCGVRVRWSQMHAERFAGAPLKNVALLAGDQIYRGDIMTTATGLEGSPVYAIGRELRGGVDVVFVDLQPDLSQRLLSERLVRLRRPKDSTASWLRKAGISAVAQSLLREATDNTLPTDPSELAALMKAVPISVAGSMPIERAISSAGGVSFDEIDDRFMLRRRPGTFIAGEMLDWDAPTGGYLLQACLSTGVAAATGALHYLEAALPGH